MQKRFIDMLFVVAAIIVATIILEKIKEQKAKKAISNGTTDKLAQGATTEGSETV